MPKDITLAYAQAKNALDAAHPWLFLYTVDVGGGSFLYLVNHPTEVIYGGNVFLPFPIAHGVMEQNQDGTIPQLMVYVANVGREIQSVLENTDGLRGQRVTVEAINLDQPSAGSIPQTFIVDSVVASSQVVEFTCSSADLAFGEQFPGRIVSRDLFPSLPAV